MEPTGGDTTFVDHEGNVILSAAGGTGALASTGTRSASDLIQVSTMLMANASEDTRTCFNLLGAGWGSL
jgi:hypothetical protein